MSILRFPEKGIIENDLTERIKRVYEQAFLERPERLFCGEGPHMINDRRRELALEGFVRFIDANCIGPTGKAVLEIEQEVVSMMGSILGNEGAVGNITTGGTESNLMAMLAARNKRGSKGSVVLSNTAHPSFYKACEYFGLEAIVVDAKPDWTADPEKIRKAVRKDTVAIVGSLGTWPYASIDPIEEMGEIAEEKDLWFHLDGAIGGMLLPFLERAGQKLPKYDFRVKSVCSVSADPHKNGMAPLSAGAIMFRDEDLHHFAKFKVSWKSGMIMRAYRSDTMLGSRPGSKIIGAWIMFNLIGVEGYIAIAKKTMELTYEMRDAFRKIPGLKLLSEPRVNLVGAYSEQYDLHKVTEELRRKGWIFFPIEEPSGLLVWLDPQNDGQVQPFLADLKNAMRLKIPR
jgi:glutamate/tyrosine decarboxylase-like PLP-dependent enzyme